ncbi:MAG TPA: ABC transporter permease subunit [Propionibacteriaceae bacterium]
MNLDWAWLTRNLSYVAMLTGQHALLALAPVLVGLVVAIPIGYLIHRTGRASQGFLAVLGVVYAIPALALFVALPALLGTKIIDPINIAVALSVYATALLVRSVVEGLRSVPTVVTQSASAVGFGPLRRLVRIELPLALPTIFSTLRTVTVTNIALVSVAVLVGSGALGQLFGLGLAQSFYTPLLVGLTLSIVLALLADLVIVAIRRGALPWARVRSTA